MNAAQMRRPGAFTLVEMLVVIGIIGLLLAMLLPVLVAGKQRAKRVVCESQLRQIGLGFQNFAHDHNNKFPMQVPDSDGGSREYVQGGYAAGGLFYFGFRHFQTLSGTLQTPAILVCPADTRPAATNFATLQNSNVSYFVNVTADYLQPMSILAGDGNLASSSTIVQGTVGGRLTWTRAQHQFKGNVLFADGHVEEWADLGPNRLGARSDLVLPSSGGGGGEKQPQSSPSAGASAGGAASGAALRRAEDQANASTNMPVTPEFHSTTAFAPARSVGGDNSRGGNPSTIEIPSPVATNVPAATNSPGGGGVRSGDDDAMMAPFDRQIAKFLRDVIIGAYLLILFLVLLFAGYRIWRHYNDPEHQRARRRTRNRD